MVIETINENLAKQKKEIDNRKSECEDCGDKKECRVIKLLLCEDCEKKLFERIGYL